jgi:hypothetical protein
MPILPERAEIIVEKAEFIETCLEILSSKRPVSPEGLIGSVVTVYRCSTPRCCQKTGREYN